MSVAEFGNQILNRLAQYLYEEVQLEPGIELVMPMTGKAQLVAVLERSIARVQRESVAEYSDAIDRITAEFKKAQEAMDALAAEAKATAQPRWNVTYLHDDCPQCEDLVEQAIQQASEQGRQGAVGVTFVGSSYEIEHRGEATRAS